MSPSPLSTHELEAKPTVASATTIERLEFWSDSLKRHMPYTVYLPKGYFSDPYRHYPVLYMLHGLGGDRIQWENVGLFTTATALIQQGTIQPMIIVAPNGENGYWIDHANNGPKFGSYISKDLVSTVDRHYRTIQDRQSRAIGGMSMGGHGALQLALNNPDLFGTVGANSVALRRHEQAFSFFGNRQYFEAHDPVSICKKSAAKAQRLTIWMDIGKNDQWYGAAKAFHEQLQAENVTHSWNVYDGGHDDAYWKAHSADYLKFYSRSFESPRTPLFPY